MNKILLIVLFLYSFTLNATYQDPADLAGGGGGGGGDVLSVFGRIGSVLAVSGDYNAAKITNVPYTQLDSSGDIVAINVQAALNELAEEKVDLFGSLALGTRTIENLNRLVLQDTDSAELITIQASALTTANYTLTLPVDDGVLGQFLTTDGAGTLSWATATVAADSIADTDGDTKIDSEENPDEDKLRFYTNGLERVTLDNVGNVGIGTNTPNASAILDIASTTKGLAIPRMTTTERFAIVSPADGLLVYDTTLNDIFFFDADIAPLGRWKPLNREIYDQDTDTGIVTDEVLDEDKIRFATAGTQRMVINETGNIYVGPELFPTSTALLDIESTTQGITIPRMTLQERDAIVTPPRGLTVYVTSDTTGPTDIDLYSIYDGLTWKFMPTSVNAVPSNVASVFGRTGDVVAALTAPFDYSGNILGNVPYTQADSSGDIVALDIQGAINELAEEKVDISGTLAAGTLAPETLNRIILKDPDSAELITVQASPTTAANYTLTLPIDDGLTGQYLTTDGLGVTSWNTPRVLQDDNGDSSVIIDSVADEIYFSTSGVLRGEIVADGTVYIGDVRTNTNDEGITYKPTTLNVGIGNDTPDASAILDIASTTDGILIPRMTTLQRTSIVTPANGLLVYDIDVNDFMYFDADLLPAPGQWKYLNRRMTDIDADTGIVLDEISDEDKIRFDTATAERMIIDDIGNVGIGTSTPDPTAILDLSSTSKGVVLPRMTTTERNAIVNPTDALLIYDTTERDYFYYDNANFRWKNINKEMVDIDGNTGIILDELPDDNSIRFVTEGAQRMVLNNEGELYIGPNFFPDPTAILEIESTTKGVVLPRMTTLEREAIPTPATGLIVFDNDIGKYFYFNGSFWLTMDGVGHGALTSYSFTVSPTQITLDQDTTFNFQRVDGVTGQEEDARVVLPAGTVVATFNVDVLPNDIRYISLVYDWDLQTFSYNYGTNPNNIDIGKEILLTGPFTNATEFIGTVNFYHYAVQSSASYGDYLGSVQRARVIDGMQLSFALPISPLPQDGSRYELTVASGRTHNSLLRSPEGAVTSFEPKNTATLNEVYYYAPNVPEYTYVAPNSGVINVGQYWDPDTQTFMTAANNQFTVTALFAYPGNTANQYLGLLVDDQFHSSLVSAKNAIFNGEVVEGKPAGLDSAALIGYLIIQGNDTADHGNFQAADQGVKWDIIGPKDNLSLTITAGGSVVPLADLSDVDTTGAIAQQILAYDGVNWVDSEYIPRNMTQAVRDALPTPTAGTLVFNTSTNQLNFYNGTSWTILGASGGALSQIQDADTDTFITTEQSPDSDAIFMQLGTTLGLYTWSYDKTGGWQVNWNNGTDNSYLHYDLGLGLLTIGSEHNVTKQAGIRLGANGGTTFTTIRPSGASVNWALTLPPDGGVNGQYLQTDGSGNTTWADAGGGVTVDNDGTPLTTAVASIDFNSGLLATQPTADNIEVNVDINGLTADATPDGAADYVMTYDASATGLKKVLLDDLSEGGGVEIVDADGDTKVTVENVADEDIIRMFAGTYPNAFGEMWMNRFVVNLFTENGLSINPREADGSPAIAGSVPLDVFRYKGSSTGVVQDVAYFRANVDVGVTPAAGDGGSINLSGHGNDTLSISLAEIDWYTTVASDPVNTVGRLEFKVMSDQSSDPRTSVQINPANLTVVGLLDSLETAGVSPASITLNDADNTNSISVQAPANVTTTQEITLPAAAPTAEGQVLSVASTAAGLTTLQWAASGGITTGNRYVKVGDVLITWGRTGTIGAGGSQTINFPQAYNQIPYITIQSTIRNGYQCATGTNGTNHNTTVSFRAYAEGGANNICDWIAIGKWQ